MYWAVFWPSPPQSREALQENCASRSWMPVRSTFRHPRGRMEESAVEQLTCPSPTHEFRGAAGFLACLPALPLRAHRGQRDSSCQRERLREGPKVIPLGRWHLDTCHLENSSRVTYKTREEEATIKCAVKQKDLSYPSHSLLFPKSPRRGRDRDQKREERDEDRPSHPHDGCLT